MAKPQTAAYEQKLTYDASIAAVQILGSNHSEAVAYGSTAGWAKWTTVDPESVSFNITPTFESVITSAPRNSQQELVMSLDGEIQITGCDLNFNAMEKANGTSLETQHTADTSAWAGTIAASTTTSSIYVGSGETTGLAVGDAVEFSFPSGTETFKQIRKVKSITAASNLFTLDWALEYVPATAGAVTRNSGAIQYHGGNTAKFRSILFQADFSQAQDQHLLHVFKAVATGGVQRDLSGKAMTPMTFKMLGESKTVGSLTGQICPAATYITYQNG